jgi:hypothetical protein
MDTMPNISRASDEIYCCQSPIFHSIAASCPCLRQQQKEKKQRKNNNMQERSSNLDCHTSDMALYIVVTKVEAAKANKVNLTM